MTKRVLIFDDDADILEVCSIVLESSGFEVIRQNNCYRVGEKVLHFRPDVVLMDNKIPPSGGIHATREIKNLPVEPSVTVVFFSANRDVAGLAREAGADYFLEKPFNLDALIGTIRKACER